MGGSFRTTWQVFTAIAGLQICEAGLGFDDFALTMAPLLRVSLGHTIMASAGFCSISFLSVMDKFRPWLLPGLAFFLLVEHAERDFSVMPSRAKLPPQVMRANAANTMELSPVHTEFPRVASSDFRFPALIADVQ